jgi:hypothetical protein
MAALIPLIIALAGGQSIGAVLGTLSVTQWVSIAGTLISAEPQLVAAFTALHPALQTLADALKNNVGAEAAGLAASAAFKAWGSGATQNQMEAATQAAFEVFVNYKLPITEAHMHVLADTTAKATVSAFVANTQSQG